MQKSGIVAECQEYFEKWNIGDPIKYSKYEYKKMIRQKMENKNLSDLVERAKCLKKVKLERYEHCDFKIQEYFKTLNL